MALRKALILVPLLALLGACVETVHAQDVPFDTWLSSLQEEAIAKGVSPATARAALTGLSPVDKVVELDRKQPEHAITFATYVKNTVTQKRIDEGRRLLHENKALLQAVSARYGVPPHIIVALWGIESSYGKNMGGFESIPALATLAYEGRRAELFRSELIEALRLVEEEGMQPSDLQGSWAGALGQCQFMPSTFRRYAVDFDGDGRRDIWGNRADVFASIARYLGAEGWKPGLGWGREVQLSKPLAADYVGLTHTETLTAWAARGVRAKDGKALPQGSLEASLVQPDGADGRSFLIYDNFRALMRWNRSTYFATTVGLFADTLNRMP